MDCQYLHHDEDEKHESASAEGLEKFKLCWFCSLWTAFPSHSFIGQNEANHTKHTLFLKKQCTKNGTEDLEYSARAVVMGFS